MKTFIPTEHFSTVSKIVHIVSATAFIAAMLIMIMSPAPDSVGFRLHQSLGLLVLVLYLVRITWMNRAGKPKALGTKIEKFMAHMALYGILIFMPLTGLLISMAKAKDTVVFGIFTIPDFAERNSGLIEFAYNTHSLLEIVCYLFVCAHVGASLYHHFILKDATLNRMMGRQK